MRARRVFAGIMALVAITTSPSPGQDRYAHFEGRQTHPIRFTPDGQRLLALNTPGARLSVFDTSKGASLEPALIAEIPVGLEPVSLCARTDDEIWVVNEVSDTVSIVSLSQEMVVATLSCPDEPADVVFAQGKAFVSCARNNLVRVFDSAARSELGTIPLKGHYPRALAVDESGTRIFVAFLHSGNGSTILPADAAPPPLPSANPMLPDPPQTAMIISAEDSRLAYSVLDHDIAEISTADHRILGYYSGVGTALFDLALHPSVEELWAANTEALNLIRFEPNLKSQFARHRITQVSLSSGRITPWDLNSGVDSTLLPNPEARTTALAQPAALAFSSDGHLAWIAAFASDRVAKLDGSEGRVIARIDLRVPPKDGSSNDSRYMRGPRGLALHEGLQRLYVLNKLANSITVIDTVTGQVVAEVPAGRVNPTPRLILEGRGFLFDARLSGNGTASCATCHIDADRDGLAWDLGDPKGDMISVWGANLAIHDPTPQQRVMHPMKGPMITQTLRGLAAGQTFHWRGDRATLSQFNSTYRDLLGGSLLSDQEMEALQAYLGTLRHHPNPNRRLDNSLPLTVQGGNPLRGEKLFNMHNNHCAVCHVPPTGSDNNVDDLRNINGRQFMKTAPLQTVYQRALLDTRTGSVNVTGFGLGHDGSAGLQHLPTVHFYELDELKSWDFADVTDFLLCFETGTAPAVGFNRTVTVANAQKASVTNDLAVIESQAQGGKICDLVVCGRIQGQKRQFYYDGASQRYFCLSQDLAPFSQSELLALLGSEDALTFLGLLPGHATQLGFSRNSSPAPPGVESRPVTPIESNSVGIPYSWFVQLSAGEGSETPPDHVGAWSWDEDGFPTTAKGWTHTSRWVMLDLTEPVQFTMKLQSLAGVPWPDEADTNRLAGTNLFPSFTLYRGWDTDPGVKLDTNGSTIDQSHTFNNRGNIEWAEDVTYWDHLDNSTEHAAERTWSLAAGRYTINLGGNSPATQAEGRQGYRATFLAQPAPLLRMMRVNGSWAIGWPVANAEFELYEAPSLQGPWIPAIGKRIQGEDWIHHTLPDLAGTRFFRLQK